LTNISAKPDPPQPVLALVPVRTFRWAQGLDKKLKQASAFYALILLSTGMGVGLDFVELLMDKYFLFQVGYLRQLERLPPLLGSGV
jgi:hypothetical protein